MHRCIVNRWIVYRELTQPVNGHHVTVCKDDAEKTIVSTSLELEENGFHATVAAYDTDIMLLLLHIWVHEIVILLFDKKPEKV